MQFANCADYAVNSWTWYITGNEFLLEDDVTLVNKLPEHIVMLRVILLPTL